MKTLYTKRLMLRKFEPSDFEAVHAYASNPDVTKYMLWGPNTKEQTKHFLNCAIAKSDENPVTNFQYVAIIMDSGKLIGACNIASTGNTAEIGWILNSLYHRQGYGTEMGKLLLEFGFNTLNLHRIIAHCDAENYGSYRIMENIGMRKEGLFIEGREGNDGYRDELSYAITKSEWEAGKEIVYYNSLPCVFNDFISVPELTDGNIRLVCIAKKPAIPEKMYVPAYVFAICKDGEQIGELNLRIGYRGFGPDESSLYYGGQIGYSISPEYRGKGYATAACSLVLPVVKAHGMTKLLITNDVNNIASRCVCEKLGLRFIRVARLPEWTDLYKEGQRFSNIFEWTIT